MSNDSASDFYSNKTPKDTVDDLLGGNFNEQPPSLVKDQIKRDQDSTDDFEHLEREYANIRESRPPNLDFDSSSEISQRLEAAVDVVEATRNLLDTSVPAFEPDLRPVPATPPPSANSDASDTFPRDTKTLPMDPKAASMAFMETERELRLEEDLLEISNNPLEKFDFTSSQSNVTNQETGKNASKTDDSLKKSDDFVKENVPAEVKKQDLLQDAKLETVDFLGEVKSKNKDIKESKDFKDEEDDTWNLVGKGKFDEPPNKPLPPLPRGGGFQAIDPYQKPSEKDKFEMSNDFLSEEALKKTKQSGNEIRDSEFESEPEPSPAKSISKIKTDISQPEVVCRRVSEKKTKDIEEIAPKQIFGNLGLDAWFNPERLNPKVAALIYWRDPKKSGIVFGALLGVLLSLAYFSLISVLAYLSLLTLTGTVAFRVYKAVMQAVQKTSDGHPFKDILDLDLTLPAEKVHEVADVAVANANAAASELRRLFLVEDLVDTLKFGVGLWCLTYLGAWFNGMTLIIIGVVALFTLPKVYETNKVQIDQNLALVQAKINDITNKVKAAIPLGKKAEPTKEE